MRTPKRWLVAALLLVIVVASGIWLMRAGVYGLAIFVLIPVLLGGIGGMIFRPRTASEAAAAGSYMVLIGLCSLLLLKLEGMICILMTLPLALPLGILGAWLVYQAEQSLVVKRGSIAMMLLLSPASLVWDTHAKPPVFAVRTAIEI